MTATSFQGVQQLGEDMGIQRSDTLPAKFYNDFICSLIEKLSTQILPKDASFIFTSIYLKNWLEAPNDLIAFILRDGSSNAKFDADDTATKPIFLTEDQWGLVSEAARRYPALQARLLKMVSADENGVVTSLANFHENIFTFSLLQGLLKKFGVDNIDAEYYVGAKRIASKSAHTKYKHFDIL